MHAAVLARLLLALLSLPLLQPLPHPPAPPLPTPSPPFSSLPVLAYTDPLSLVQCSTLNLYVSSPSSAYRIDFLRFGGPTPQIMASLSLNNGHLQTTPRDAAANGAKWSLSASYQDTCDWPSGLYAAKVSSTLLGPHHTIVPTTTYASFVVRPLAAPPTPHLLVVASTNTWAAYNPWPSNGSFYSPSRPTRVSYLRPDPSASPLLATSHLAGAELHVLQWLESHHYAYDLITDIDLNDTPDILAWHNYYAVVLSTHSEYWTDPMYTALASYLRLGGRLLSLSGNTMYRRETLLAPAPNQWSTQLIGGLKPLRAPASVATLIGLYYRSTAYTCAPYRVLLKSSFLLAGVRTSSFGATGQDVPTGCFHNAAGIPPGASGWEFDSRFTIPNARTYQVIATGTNPHGGADLIYYRPHSGGEVINFGSITLGNSLLIDPVLSRIVSNALDHFRFAYDIQQLILALPNLLACLRHLDCAKTHLTYR
jgi:hypothetical protein